MRLSEALFEDYRNNMPAKVRKQANKICQKYCGWHTPQEIAPMWDELYDMGIEILITGYPDVSASGTESWTVHFDYNGETCDNSAFVYDVYKGNRDTEKNEYNMYFG